ncbi:MAG: class IV adenylate cyclase [Planctomycetota bacterium]|jgi:adenylate cyclase class 2
MAHEIEAKFKVDSHQPIRRALKRLGAQYVATVVQEDSYFDTPDKALLAKQSGLRVREIRVLRSAPGVRPNGQPTLTYKGPLQAGRKAKVRREIETHFETPGSVEQILRGLDYHLILSFQKRRTTYRLGRCLIELDELPLLGTFVEVEGPSERLVVSVAGKLGLTGESIKISYAHLIADAAQAAGRKPLGIKLKAGRK